MSDAASSNSAPQSYWRKCSSCKKPIGLGAQYFICSVSTCNNPRTGYAFCSVHCFERHLPGARHKDAGAIEKTAPHIPHDAPAASTPASSTASSTSSQGAQAEARTPNRVFAKSPSATASSPRPGANLPREVLVIASRLKDYIAARSEFNTSGSVMDVLSDHLRIICDRAIDNARADGRKTVMDRDFEFLKK